MTDVIQLLRVSTEGQAATRRNGLQAQRRSCQETASRFGLRIVGTVELVISGTDVAETPEMDSLLQQIECGRATGIVVAAYDRLFRPERWSDMLVLQRLLDASGRIFTPQGEIDLATEAGHIMASLYNLLSSLERRRIQERMRRGKEEARRQGRHVGGPVQLPFGVTYSKECGWAWTADAEIVRELFRRFLQGEGTVALSDAFGIAPSSVRYILSNEVYTGWRIYDEKRDPSPQGRYPSGTRRKIARREDEVIRVRLDLDPIVSEEDFRAVQALLQRSRLRSARAKAQTYGMFVYQGILFCDRCGEPCYSARRGTYKDGTPKGFYFCKSRSGRGPDCCGARYMSYRPLEENIDQVLALRLTSNRFLRRVLNAYEHQQKHREPAPIRQAIASKIRDLSEKRRRVLDTYIDGIITKMERDRRLAELDEERSRFETLHSVEAGPAVITVEELAEVFSVFHEWKYLEYEDKRGILQALTPRIYVDDYEARGLWLPGDVAGISGDAENSRFRPSVASLPRGLDTGQQLQASSSEVRFGALARAPQ